MHVIKREPTRLNFLKYPFQTGTDSVTPCGAVISHTLTSTATTPITRDITGILYKYTRSTTERSTPGPDIRYIRHMDS